MKRKNKRILSVLLVLVLMLGLIVILYAVLHKKPETEAQTRELAITLVPDSLVRPPDTARGADDPKIQLRLETPSVATRAVEARDVLAKPLKQIDTIKLPPREKVDSVPPYLFADPAGGFFGDTVRITLKSDEPSSIFFKTADMAGWAAFSEQIIFTSNGKLSFYGMDTMGNKSVEKTEYYDVSPGADNPCPKGMAWVQTAQGFCMDMYEWPNKKGTLPTAMMTYYAAKDSCLSIGKRLCTSQEWYIACSGPRTTKYSYGNQYESRSCNTAGDGTTPSGGFAECRGYWGVMDMIGNLREWTDTRSTENRRFYKVHGGFWESQSRSDCSAYQYSFYPQNKHLSVGFRCCKNAGQGE